MRKIYNTFGIVSNVYSVALEQMKETTKSFVETIIRNRDTFTCGELLEERLRIKNENSFTGDINIVVVDNVIYREDLNKLLVYDEDGGVLEWDELYIDDMIIIANAIYVNFKKHFVQNNFAVFANDKLVTDEPVDYLTAYELEKELLENGHTNVGIDEVYTL
jgi:hypothetical protein